MPAQAAIRLATADDAEAIAAIYGPIVESTAISFEIQPPSALEMRARITDTIETHPWLVFEDGGRVVAYAYASRHRARSAYQWSVDTSVYVGAEARGRGIGRRLYGSLFAVLEAQGFINAFAGIALPNPASVGLHESSGFRALGVYQNVGYKLGAWHDVGWWQKTIALRPVAPLPPLTISDVRRRSDWAARLGRGLE